MFYLFWRHHSPATEKRFRPVELFFQTWEWSKNMWSCAKADTAHVQRSSRDSQLLNGDPPFEAHSKPCQISNMEIFAKIVNRWMPLIIVGKMYKCCGLTWFWICIWVHKHDIFKINSNVGKTFSTFQFSTFSTTPIAYLQIPTISTIFWNFSPF